MVGLKHTISLSTLLFLGEKVPFKLDLIGQKKKKVKKKVYNAKNI